MNNDEKILVLGALLHDIGKFLQRARTDLDRDHKEINSFYAHPKWSAGFIDEYIPEKLLKEGSKRIIGNIVISHHNPQILEYKDCSNILDIVIDSDKISAAEREKREMEEKGDPEKEFLFSPFCNVSAGDKVNKVYYPLLPLIEEHIAMLYPKPKEEIMQIPKRGYKDIWNQFEEEIKKLNTFDLNFTDYVNSLNYLLFKYLRFMPSAAYVDIPDIPLYDHLKTSAAIALCKYRTENKNRPYLLIEGDISGIQNFIFYAQKPMQAAEKSAKRLRGRSFFINLLIDAIVALILDELDLPEMNVLLQSGGHFIILAPNTEENIKKVRLVRKNANKYLYNEYGSILYMAISYLQGSDEDIKDYSKFREKLGVETEKIKNRKFEELIDELFVKKSEEKVLRESDICVVCGINKKERIEIYEDEYKVCGKCYELFDLGNKIVDCGYILRYFGDGGDFTIVIGDKKISYDFIKRSIKIRGDKPSLYRLNNFDFITEHKSMHGFRLIGIHVPFIKENNTIRTKTFDEITKPIRSKEHIKLAILKADVDNLGWIFSKGIKKELRSISRISTMSFLFDLFFSLYVNELAAKKKKKEHGCYIIFSGGDDLIVVGRFDEIIKFAKNLSKSFNEWVSTNSNITISVGIEIAHYKFPVKRLVEYAGDALEKSKSIDKCEKCGSEKVKKLNNILVCKECKGKSIRKKDKLTLFDRTLYWWEFENVLSVSETIEENEDSLSSGILYQLFSIWCKSNEKITSRKSIIVNPDPYVKYCLVRNWKGEKDEKFNELEKEIIKNFKLMDVVVSLYSLLHRYGLKLGGEKNVRTT